MGGWSGMRYWDDNNSAFTVFNLHRQNDDGWPVLASVLLAKPFFVGPQVAVSNDLSGLRWWNVHLRIFSRQRLLQQFGGI